MVQLVLLAGGLGSRLMPLTQNLPKPMAPAAGKPFLAHLLSMYAKQGFKKALMLTGYQAQAIEDYFGKGSKWNMEITYSREPKPMGTGGALRLALPLLDPVFLLAYGDSYLEIDYSRFYANFEDANVSAMIGVWDNRKENADTPGNVDMDPNGKIISFKKNNRNAATPFVEAGVSILNRTLIESLPENKTLSLEEEVFPQLIKNAKLAAYVVENRFYDIGTPERLKSFENKINQGND